jgi:hypothetical protein
VFVHLQSKNGLPRHRVVQLTVKIGESRNFDNTFFYKSHWRNLLRRNWLPSRAGFYHISLPGLNGAVAKGSKGSFLEQRLLTKWD